MHNDDKNDFNDNDDDFDYMKRSNIDDTHTYEPKSQRCTMITYAIDENDSKQTKCWLNSIYLMYIYNIHTRYEVRQGKIETISIER